MVSLIVSNHPPPPKSYHGWSSLKIKTIQSLKSELEMSESWPEKTNRHITCKEKGNYKFGFQNDWGKSGLKRARGKN